MKQPRRKTLAVAALLLLGLFTGWAAITGLQARSALLRARDRLDTAQADKSTLDSEGVLAVLLDAQHDLRVARGRLRQPGPRLIAAIPVLGRSLTAGRATAEAGYDVVTGTVGVLRVTTTGAPVFSDGTIDTTKLGELSAALDAAARRSKDSVARLRRTSTSLVLKSVRNGVDDARTELGGAADSFGRAKRLLDGVAGVVGARGERRLLVVLQNNAELRGTGGLVSVFAEATARNGKIEIGAFRDIDDVSETREVARRVEAPADYTDLYGTFLANTTLWKNANMSPDVPTVAQVMSRLAGLTVGTTPDAVVFLDVPAIAAILKATGPAALPNGRRLTGDNAVDELLVRAYAGVPDTRKGQAERRKDLRGAADAVIDRLFNSGDVPTVPLAKSLGDAARGRHIAVWSARPDEQADLVAGQASGTVCSPSTDLVMTSVLNFGGGQSEGNKLDYYVAQEHRVEVTVERDAAVTRRTFRLRNDAPRSGLSAYVAGLETPGQARSLVHFSLPQAAELTDFSRNGAETTITTGTECGHQVIGDFAALDPGASVEWELTYRTPRDGDGYDLRLLPQPLARPAALELTVRGGDGVVLSDVRGGSLRYNEDWDSEILLEMRADGGSRWQRFTRAVRNFWSEPVL